MDEKKLCKPGLLLVELKQMDYHTQFV